VINSKSTAGNWRFGNKIMYGSDWHMIEKEGKHREYLDIFNGLFSDPDLKPWQRAFFCRNAIAYLQLSRAQEPLIEGQKPLSDSQLKRLKDILKRAADGPKSGPEEQ
jgi:hypothetical protein